VRLFHRESECYVVAEGSFANEKVMTQSGMYSKTIHGNYAVTLHSTLAKEKIRTW